MLLFLKYYLRYFSKNRTVSMVNLLGLTIAIAAAIVILIYSTFEHSFDKFSTNFDNIYRVHVEVSQNGSKQVSSYGVNLPTGLVIKSAFPEIKAFARIVAMPEVVFTYNNHNYAQEKVFFVDSSFFQIFTMPCLKGNTETALKSPNSAVITRSTALKYFGQTDPIGKFLMHSSKVLYQVLAVVDDVPENSHFQFQVLLSFHSDENWLHKYNDNSWGYFFAYTYLLLDKSTDVAQLSAKIDNLLNTHKPIDDATSTWKHSLQPMKDFHLHSKRDYLCMTTDGNIVQIIGMVALLILIIGYINQTNISIAQTLERLKVVAISRVLGNKPRNILLQFIFESVLTTLVSFSLALILCTLLSPWLSTLFQFTFSLKILSIEMWIGVLLGLIGIATIMGIYPAFVVLSHNTYECLKSKAKHAGVSVFFRKALIVIQYSIACVLIIGALVIYLQKEYMLNKDLGIEINNTIVVRGASLGCNDSILTVKLARFKSELKALPQIIGVTASNALPSNGNYQDGLHSDIQNDSDWKNHAIYQVDHDFINVFKIKIIAGRDFSKDHPSDFKFSSIINEKAVKALGFKTPEEAIGHIITRDWDKNKSTIIGVVKDYHSGSLSSEIPPITHYLPDIERRFFSVRYVGENTVNTINIIKSKWEIAFPGEMFSYFVLQQSYNNLYKNEAKYGFILGLFSMLAIVLSCFGLFGLSFYTIVQRTKEIGVRKINGASSLAIILILLADFSKLILTAFLVACPVGYFLASKWLDGFAYKISLSWWIFALAGLIAMTIAITTVIYQAWLAASKNPVEALRYE